MTNAQGDRDGSGPSQRLEKATFAGGCFWCMQPPYDTLKGVIYVTVGYTGGHTGNPSYEEVSSGRTGHCEAVEIVYDPSQITYAELLDLFWRNIDPTALNRQFVDAGTQYRTAIFYHTGEQKKMAEESKVRIEQSGRFGSSIVTEIVPVSPFYPAEEYHQGYYTKNPLRYEWYHFNSGREQYLKNRWEK